jgi:hypothetical protein
VGSRNKFSFLLSAKYNRFIILAVDQDVQSATGCSIDASVEFIQSLEQKIVDLLDKMNVTFKLGEHIAHKPLIDFKKMVKDKAVTGNTIVFNLIISEYNESWTRLLIVGMMSLNIIHFNEKYRHQNLFSLCLIFFITSCIGIKNNKHNISTYSTEIDDVVIAKFQNRLCYLRFLMKEKMGG